MWGKKKASKSQLTARSTFVSVTQCDNKVADLVLKKFRYDLQAALNHYWSNRDEYPANVPKAPSATNVKQLETLFDSYTGDDEKDSTSQDGLMKFYENVGIDPMHRYALYVAYILKAETSGEISRKEFVNGCGGMGAFKLADIKSKLKTRCGSIDKSKSEFDACYVWLFTYLKENAQKKSIPKDIACIIWGLVLKDRGLKLLDDFLKFVEDSSEDVKGITSDTWINAKKFLEECNDPKNFENDGAWPILVDSYLEARDGS